MKYAERCILQAFYRARAIFISILKIYDMFFAYRFWLTTNWFFFHGTNYWRQYKSFRPYTNIMEYFEVKRKRHLVGGKLFQKNAILSWPTNHSGWKSEESAILFAWKAKRSLKKFQKSLILAFLGNCANYSVEILFIALFFHFYPTACYLYTYMMSFSRFICTILLSKSKPLSY